MGNEKQLNIDSIAKELHEVTKMIEKLKTRKHELELTLSLIHISEPTRPY